MARTRHTLSVEPDPRVVRRNTSRNRKPRTKTPERPSAVPTSHQRIASRRTASRRSQSVPVNSSPPQPLPASRASRRATRAASKELDNQSRRQNQKQTRPRRPSPPGNMPEFQGHKTFGPATRSNPSLSPRSRASHSSQGLFEGNGFTRTNVMHPVLENVVEEEEEEEMISLSGTQLEADNVDADEVIEQIPELNQKSDQILESLLSSKTDHRTLLRHLRQPGHPSGRRLRQKQKYFELVKQTFGTTEFINPRVLAEAIDYDIFRPILYKANMTALCIFLCTAQAASDTSFQYLQNLETNFPAVLTENDLSDELTADLLLDIRTQEFICALPQFQSVKSDEILSHFFLEDDDDDEFRAAGTQEWMAGKKPKNWAELSDRSREDLLARLADIRGTYDEEDIEPDPERLMHIYLWDNFVSKFLGYIRREVDRIQQEVFSDKDDTSKIDKLVEIAQEIAERAANEQDVNTQQTDGLGFISAEAQPLEEAEEVEATRTRPEGSKQMPKKPTSQRHQPQQSSKPGETKVVSSIQGISALKSFMATKPNPSQQIASSNKTQPPQLPIEARPLATVNDNINATLINDVEEERPEDRPSTSVKQQLGLYNKIQINKNKENRFEEGSGVESSSKLELLKTKSFIDPQKGAYKIVWNGDEEELMATQHKPQPPRDKGKKRAIAQLEPENEEEDDYGPDNRLEDEGRKKISRQAGQHYEITRQGGARGESPVKKRKLNEPQVQQTGRDDPEALSLEASSLLPPRTAKARKSPKRLMSKSLPSPAVADSSHQPRDRGRSASLPPEASTNRRHTAPGGDRRRYPRGAGVDGRRLPEGFDTVIEHEHEEILNELHGERDSNEEPRTLKARVKHVAKMNKELTNIKQPLKRRRWTDKEEKKLVDMVAIHGCKWALIKERGGRLLSERSQVMLKDKARNMKFLYLKSQLPLPPNFDNVTLSQHHIKQLTDMGIHYEYKGHYETPRTGSDEEEEEDEETEDSDREEIGSATDLDP